MLSSPRHRFIVGAVTGYVTFAAAWIVLSDWVLFKLADTDAPRYGTIKGLLFVVITAALLSFCLANVPSATPKGGRTSATVLIGWRRLALALMPPLVAAGMQWLLIDLMTPFPFVLQFPAVLLSAWLGGLIGGMAATTLATALVGCLFIPGQGVSLLDSPSSVASMGIFFGVGCLLSWLLERLRIAERQAADSRYRTVFENSPDCIFVKDLEGRYLLFNDAAARFVGMPASHVLGKTDAAIFPAEVARYVHEMDAKVMASGQPQTHQETVTSLAGRVATFHVTKGPVLGPNGTTIGLFGISRDITETAHAQALAKERDDLLQDMSAMAHIGAWSIDPATGGATWTEEVSKILGLTPVDAPSLNMALSHFADEDRDAMATAIRQAIDHALPFDCHLRIQASDDAIKWVRVIGHPELRDGTVIRLTGTLQDISEQVAAEKALHDSRERLKLFIEHAPAALAMFDHDMRYVAVSRRWLKDYGLEGRDIIGQSHYDIFPEVPAYWKSVHQRGLAGEFIHANEDRFERLDGSLQWLRWEVIPWRTLTGTVGGIMLFTEDITRMIDTQNRIRMTEARYHSVLDNAADAVLIANRDGQFVYANYEISRILGYNPEELTTLGIPDVTPPEDMDIAWNAFHEVQNAGHLKQELRLLRKDGSVVPVEINSIMLPDGTAFGAFRDITDRKAAAVELERYRLHLEQRVQERTAELALAESKLKLIIESTADGLYGIDTKGNVTFFNPEARAILGYAEEQLVGTSSHATFHHSHADGQPYAQRNCPIAATLQHGRPCRVDHEVYWHLDGRAVPVSYSAHPMVEGGIIIGAVVSFHDISKRVTAEAARDSALREAERLASLRREFLANMSHEIRTPLNAVLGLAQIGERENAGRKSQMVFNRILDAGQGLMGIIDDILDFSKIDSGKMTVESIPMEIGHVIDASVQLVAIRAHAKGIRLSVEESPDLPARCLGDPKRLQQVLLNLLTNAIKFTPEGGAITVTATIESRALVFRVIDTGIGISADHLERLFQPFEQADGSTTRRYGGTGLGLTISRNLVTMMGGTISVISREAEGSTFVVRLPAEEAEAAPPPPAGMVAVAGLTEHETETTRSILKSCQIVPPGGPVPEGVALLLMDQSQLDDPAIRETIDQRVPLGLRVVVVVPPNSIGLPQAFWGKVAVIERPFRVRHVIAAWLGALDSSTMIKPLERLQGITILAAEDNEINRLVLEDTLTGEGAKVLCFANGRLAVDHLKLADISAIDAVVTDIQMPDMDGYDVARAIGQIKPGLPVIGLTAHAMAEEQQRCLDAGMVEHLVKPVDRDRLVSVILRHVPIKAASHGAPAMIDHEALLARYGGREDFVHRLIATVLSSQDGTARELREAIKTSDTAEIARLAHTVKGTAGNLAAPRLSSLATVTERAAKTNQPDTPILAERLAQSVDAMLADLTQLENADA